MAYTALAEMRLINKQRCGTDAGPMPPLLHCTKENPFDLKSSALRFLHERCEGLRFCSRSVSDEMASGELRGTGLRPQQIPYNMQMDIDRLCLERELEVFIDSGLAEDAYTVYYCYLEMFLGAYGKSKKMVELLSEYEMNGSSLLMKHRDHYSHSVYVFALGLAIYENNAGLRSAFMRHYHIEEEHRAACTFLEYWGLASLFHDIGYPFELPFEQVASYFESSGSNRSGNPYLAYRGMDSLIGMSSEEQRHFEQVYGRSFHTTNELFAYTLTEALGEKYGFSEGYLLDILNKKPTHPEDFNYFIDHAFFSATRLYRELIITLGVKAVGKAQVDALTAILLHNSLYKFIIADDYRSGKKPAFSASEHPLAFLLMLCDELQCWDRTAYGRQSRRELHPVGAEFDFNGDTIRVCYVYDADALPDIHRYEHEYRRWIQGGCNGDAPRLKEYSDMVGEVNRFADDIRLIVDLSNIGLAVLAKVMPLSRKNKHTYLSSSSFMHLYDFAAAINARRSYQGREDEIAYNTIGDKFDRLSLEYKLSGLNRAKRFSRYLHRIHCFYTDRPVDFEALAEFSAEQLDCIAPLEHERWIEEHRKSGWNYGTAYEDYGKEKQLSADEIAALREQMRCHKLMMNGVLSEDRVKEHYDGLSEADKDKDSNAMNSMLRLLKFNEGAKIYRLD